MTEPKAEPTDPWPAPRSMPLAFMEGRLTTDGAYSHQINGQDVPPGVLRAVRAAAHDWARENDRLRQQLRQQLTEREVTDLRGDVYRLRELLDRAVNEWADRGGEPDEIAQVRREGGLT